MLNGGSVTITIFLFIDKLKSKNLHALLILKTVDLYSRNHFEKKKILAAIEKVFDLSPGGIVRDLKLIRPIYKKTAAYGHFGREEPEFNWERKDRVEQLRKAVAWNLEP